MFFIEYLIPLNENVSFFDNPFIADPMGDSSDIMK